MINIQNGELKIANLIISPKINKDDFIDVVKKNKLLKAERDMKNSYHWYYFNTLQLAGLNMAASVCFYKSNLNIITFSNTDSSLGSSWEDWSKEKELERKNSHNQWLQKVLGNPPYEYDWGSIKSDYDEKSAFSIIMVNFKELKAV